MGNYGADRHSIEAMVWLSSKPYSQEDNQYDYTRGLGYDQAYA